MIARCVTGLLLVAVAGAVQADDPADALKALARSEFEKADYNAAVAYLQQAREVAPKDAEVYYYLGYYTHYLCYDSVPLSGFDRGKSDEVLGYLRKAVELDPDLGDAYYFIGAEYGARARDELRDGDVAGAAEQFRRGREEGGYPAWMLEFGRNLLRSCERDAILVTGGDADTNPIQYLQIVEGYRTDVTVIPVALLKRPWFVLLLKDGLDGAVRPAPLSWSEKQILDMHPYKWQAQTIQIPIADSARRRHGTKNESIDWELADENGCIGPGRAALADILITNQFKRPVCFSSGVSNAAFDGLQDYIQLSGIGRRLLPMETPGQVDVVATAELLLEPRNFEAVPSVRTQDMPRVSNLLVNYWASYLYLALHYSREDDAAMVETVIAAMKRNVPEGIVPMPEGLQSSIAKFDKWIADNR